MPVGSLHYPSSPSWLLSWQKRGRAEEDRVSGKVGVEDTEVAIEERQKSGWRGELGLRGPGRGQGTECSELACGGRGRLGS